MVSIVAGGIPYKLRERDVQCMYLHGALQLAEKPAAVAVREGILAAAVNHLLGLDVEIRWQDIAAAEAGISRPTSPCAHIQLLTSLSNLQKSSHKHGAVSQSMCFSLREPSSVVPNLLLFTQASIFVS